LIRSCISSCMRTPTIGRLAGRRTASRLFRIISY
jgi:hypothetical protein